MISIYFEAFCQNKSIKALYGVKFLEYDNNTEGARFYNSIIDRQNNFLNKLKFEMKASSNESSFESKEILIEDSNRAHSMALNSSNYHNTYYTNTEAGFYQVNYNNKAFNVTVMDSLKGIEWKILKNQNKIIHGCSCIKATAKIDIDLIKKYTKIVESYFCPKINFKFGPLNYYGLPGLIYELRENNVVYTLEELDIVDKFEKSLKIKSDKFYNENEFKTILKEKIISTLGEEALKN